MPTVVPSRPAIVAIEAMVERAIRFRSRSGVSRLVASSIARWVSAIFFSASSFLLAGHLLVALEARADDVRRRTPLRIARLDRIVDPPGHQVTLHGLQERR